MLSGAVLYDIDDLVDEPTISRPCVLVSSLSSGAAWNSALPSTREGTARVNASNMLQDGGHTQLDAHRSPL